MTNRQNDTSREVRLWIKDIIMPVVTTTIVVMSIPEVRQSMTKKCNKVKNSISSKFKKKSKNEEKELVEIGLDDNCIQMFNMNTGEYRIKRR